MVTSINRRKSRFEKMEIPVVMVPLTLYSDDLSGNKSNKYNSFDVWAMMLAGLPREDNAKLSNIHFIAGSNRVKAVEMSKPIVDDLLKLEDGIVMFDAMTKQEVLVVAPVLCIMADNVRASELTNHMGSSANRYCRMCLVHI